MYIESDRATLLCADGRVPGGLLMHAICIYSSRRLSHFLGAVGQLSVDRVNQSRLIGVPSSVQTSYYPKLHLNPGDR